MKQFFILLALTLPVVWLVVSLVFLLVHLVPGDPIQMTLGEGATLATAISNRDYALVQGCLLSIGLTYVLISLFTDLVYRFVNPRMR